jgi:hypothetical protein
VTIPAPLSPPRRRSWRPALALVVAGAAIWFATHHAWGVTPGPLINDVGESVSIPRATGQVWVYGDAITWNAGSRPAVLNRIALVKPTPGLKVLDTFVSGPRRKLLGLATWGEWPSKEFQDVHRVAGFQVAPRDRPSGDRGVELLFVLRSDQPGRYSAPGVVVDYTVDGKAHRRYLNFAIGVCVHAPSKPKDRNCPTPEHLDD